MLNNLVDNINLPMNEDLLNLFIDEYLKISYKDVKELVLGGKTISDLLYIRINDYDKNLEKVNLYDEKIFFDELSKDYTESGISSENPPILRDAGWDHFKSWKLLGTDKISSKDQLHRFYIGVRNKDIYKFVKSLYDEFKSVNIPFYFKISRTANNRPDNLVIYTSLEYLENTMLVLDNVSRENSEILCDALNPTFVVGNYTNKIGYANEIKDMSTSYTDLLCIIFTRVLHNAVREYAANNPNSEYKNIYKTKLESQIENYGEPTSEYALDMAKDRILCSILLKNDCNFKKTLLEKFRKSLDDIGLDKDNICFSKAFELELRDLISKTK